MLAENSHGVLEAEQINASPTKCGCTCLFVHICVYMCLYIYKVYSHI